MSICAIARPIPLAAPVTTAFRGESMRRRYRTPREL